MDTQSARAVGSALSTPVTCSSAQCFGALYLSLQSADLDLCCETTACITIRPKLIIDERGNPTHLINGIARTGDDTCGDHPGDHTFTFVQPIAQ